MLNLDDKREIYKDEYGEVSIDEGNHNSLSTISVDVRELECPEHTMMLKLALRKHQSEKHKQVIFVTKAKTIINETNIKMVEQQLGLRHIAFAIANGNFDAANEDNPIWVTFEVSPQ